MINFKKDARYLTAGFRIGKPIKGSTEWDFADRIQSLWTQYAGSRRTVPFIDPSIAPFATIAAPSTTYSCKWLSSTGTNLNIPWMVQYGHDRVLADLVFGVASPIGNLEARLSAVTLWDSVVTKVGDWAPVDGAGSSPIPMADWQTRVPSLRMLQSRVSIEPNLPSGRQVALKVQLRQTLVGTNTTDLAVTPIVYLAWANLQDSITERGG